MSLFFSSSNKTSQIENFINGSSDKLLIIGYSGSGKTTLAKKLADKYSARYISLDDFFFKNQMLKKENPQLYEQQRTEYEKKILFGNGRYVIEGVGIMRNKSSEIYDLPTIILGTSFTISSIRGGLRNIRSKMTNRNKFKELITPFQKNAGKYHRMMNSHISKLELKHKLQKFK